MYMSFSSLELFAGGGGQALGLEQAGFHHDAVVEYEPHFCTTLRKNRPHWNVIQKDVREISGKDYKGIDLLCGGVPCPPFSIAGKQLGANDERDMFPAALRLVSEIQPRAVLFENVPGLGKTKFESYRKNLLKQLARLGYQADWRILQAADFGVPQLRPRFIMVALRAKDAEHFSWPIGNQKRTTVGDTLIDLMSESGWLGAEAWAQKAQDIAPTIVGGSKKHGGPDLGPTRAKQKWLELGVNGKGIGNEAPPADAPFNHIPKLTIPMVARLQSFPDTWQIMGGKTAAYRQIGNAFPPKVAKVVGLALMAALKRESLNAKYKTEESVQPRLLSPARKYTVKKKS